MAENQNLTSATIRGAIWGYTSTYGGKLLTFFATTILAWLLTQDDFGVAGYAMVAMNFLDVLSNLGIGAAVIYHKEDERVTNTAFWLSLVTGILFFSISWLVAPLIGRFFNDLRSIPLTRALGTTFIFSGISTVPNSLLSKQLNFGKKVIPDLTRAASKGVIAILFALAGFGAWSLVLGQVGSQLVSMVIYWWVVPWRPSLDFSFSRARVLLTYGSGMISINFLGVLLLNLDSLFIGRFLTTAALGVYSLAFRVPELLIKRFSGTLAGVVFPVFTRLKEKRGDLGDAFIQTLYYVAIITTPMGLGLALVAEPFVLTIFSAKWVEAIPVLRAIAIFSLLTALTFNMGDILKAQGRLATLTTISFFRLLVSVPVLWWAISRWGTITAVAWAQVGLAGLNTLVNLAAARYLLQIPLKRMLVSFKHPLISGAMMSAVLLPLLHFFPEDPPVIPLLAALFFGAATYLGTLKLLQPGFFRKAGSMLQAALQGR